MPKPSSVRWTAAGWGLASVLTGTALVRVFRPERTIADIAVTAAVPWGLAPSWPLLAGALITRRRGLATLASVLAAYHAVCLGSRAQRWAPAPHDAKGPHLRVAFANVWARNANVEGILEELAMGNHDIVALAEVTTRHTGAIDAVLPEATYPWRWSAPDGSYGSRGFALVSRVPLDKVETWWSQGHDQVDLVVQMPGALPCRLLVVHTWGPVHPPSIKRWRAQLVDIADRAHVSPGRRTDHVSPGRRTDHVAPARRTGRSAPTGTAPDTPTGTAPDTPTGTAPAIPAGTGQGIPAGIRPTVIMGDFNATHQHRSFERLVRGGWTDAASLRFGGWRATWPANRRWRPPIIGIDHILVGPGISVRSGRAGRARGSDHRPVSAVVVLPPG